MIWLADSLYLSLTSLKIPVQLIMLLLINMIFLIKAA